MISKKDQINFLLRYFSRNVGRLHNRVQSFFIKIHTYAYHNFTHVCYSLIDYNKILVRLKVVTNRKSQKTSKKGSLDSCKVFRLV